MLTLRRRGEANRPASRVGPGRAGSPVGRPRLTGVDGIVQLQRSAGNAAVSQAILAQRDAEADTAKRERLAMAVAGGDWTGAATLLLGAEERWMVQRLHNFDADQLRYLDDAVRRMGVKNSRLRIFIKAGLMQQGANDDTDAPGAGYGVIEGKATRITDGHLHPGPGPTGNNTRASYTFEITFQPNTATVNATQIAFIQMARVVSTTASTPDAVGVPNPQNRGANGANRQTADHARVDRIPGMDYGWIGVGDNGLPTSHLRPWQAGSKSPAWMTDTPSRTMPNVTFSFETAAICRQGPDAGKVYATVQWGFSIDAAMKVVPGDTKYFNKESSDFDLAVTFWNAEASAAGSTQKQLPSNLH